MTRTKYKLVPKKHPELETIEFASDEKAKPGKLTRKHDETSDASSDENDDSDSIDYDALKLTSAVKQFHIKTVGPVLTIHLKRFSQTGYGLQKLHKRVEFPLVLDMSPFCVSDTSVLKDCNNQILCGLRGIVEHSSGMSGGHYVAYVNIADWNAQISFVGENGTCKSPDSDHKLAHSQKNGIT